MPLAPPQSQGGLPAVWLVGLAVLIAFAAQLGFALDLSVAAALALYLAAAALFAHSRGAMDAATRAQSQHRPAPTPAQEWLMLGALLAVATFFRLYRIDSQPMSLWIDETLTALNALEIIEGKTAPLWAMTPLDRWRPDWVKTSNLFLHYVAAVFKVFGTGYFALKMVSILPAVAGVLAAYFLFKAIAGPATACMAALLMAVLLMAVSQWHVTISRWGWDALLMSLLQLGSYYYLIRAIKGGRRINLLLSGALMGLCLYTYAAAWLVLMIPPAVLMLPAADSSKPPAARLRDTGIFLLTALLVFAPLGIYYLNHPGDFLVRAGEVSILHEIAAQQSLAPLWDNLRNYALMFNYRGDGNARHGFPNAPMLDFLTSILFVLGLAHCLRLWRRSEYLMVLLWFALGIQAGVLADAAAAPNGYRTLLIIPAVCFFAASGAERLWRHAADSLPRLGKSRWVPWAVGAILVGYLTIENYATYFVRRPSASAVWNEESRDRRLPARIKALQAESQLLVVDPLLLWKVVVVNTWFLTYQPGRLFESPYVPANFLIGSIKFPEIQAYDRIVYVFPPVFHNLLQSLFPKAEGEMIVTPDGEAVYGILRLSAAEFNATMQSLDKTWLAATLAKIALLYENRAGNAAFEIGPTEAILRDAARAGFAFAEQLDPAISAKSLR